MDTVAHLNSLKKHVFCELLRIAGRAFVLVRYSEHVVLGNRGFNAEEKEKGIVLVFSSGMHFQWDEYGITATLVFGSSPQKCFIPVDDIAAVYSYELGTQFIVSPLSLKMQGESAIKAEAVPESPDNVIKVDFKKKQLRHDPEE